MITPIESILSRINQNNPAKRLKILSIFAHESYSTLMGDLPHDFYGLQGPNIKVWDFRTKPLPKNHFILQKPYPQHFPSGLEFDLILSGDRFSGFQILDTIAKQLKIPHINMLHHLPQYGAKPKQLAEMKALRADAHVFVGEASKQMWDIADGKVIRYGLDEKLYSGWTGKDEVGIQVVNQLMGRDVFCGAQIFAKVAQSIPLRLLGDNPGISEMAKSTEELVAKVANCRFYLNTSLYSNCPMGMCEALMIGIPVVSTRLFETPYIITHGENGFLYDTPEEAIEYCNMLLKDFELAKRIGAAGRETALKLFNQDRFIKEWDDVITSCYLRYR